MRGALVAAGIMALFVVIGLSVLIGMLITKLKCREEVEAVVDELIPNHDGETGPSFYPVFLYRYEGVDYRRKSNFAASASKFKVGDPVKLFVDPDKPEKFYCPRETASKVITILLFTASSALILAFFWFADKNG
ncbi:DUF3592 domain-containing protein [Ruminococcus flavefaciens]|uniref:DUF3592 domain-containing protein n=1 Tax=Ruminococcus flavefaciens 007c TaxID=1341157 RepID=W7UUH7_RUMFL|nr:DUF3592 domain-containing protein [Ruminococcus flavefaciens]EWM52485.1 hypothetical protein RF007C_08075 [Ruminococcus flavefaciens 007c]